MSDLAALFVAYLVSQFYRSFLAVLAPSLTTDLGVGPVDLSNAAGAWFAAFALAQIPVGLALDRFGPRRIVGWAMFLGAGGGALVFAFAQGAWALIAGMAMIGAGCAPILMAGMFLFARRYAMARFASLSGMMIAFGSLGNVLGAAPLAYAVDSLGWRAVVIGLAALAAAIAALVTAVMVDPERLRDPGDAGLAGIVTLLRMRALWPLLPLALFNYAMSAGIRGAWAGPYLADIHGMDAIGIGLATTWMAAAMAAGSLLIGSADRVLGTRKWLVIGCNGAGAASVFWLSRGVGADMATALMTVIGFSAASYAVLMAHARSLFPPHLAGRGVTLMNFFGIGGVGLGQFATGRVFDWAARDGSDAAYGSIFLYYALTVAGALAIYLFSRDAKP